jgi:hypothetical protein
MNRQLTEEERKFTVANVAHNKKKIEFLQYSKEYNELLISKGLKANYEMQLEDAKIKLQKINQDMNELKFSNEQAEKQLKEGVEEKQNGTSN